MRIIALLASYNEARFIRNCIEHLLEHGVEVYCIDNESTDGTLDIIREYLHKGVIGVETFERAGMYRWRPLLDRKEQLAEELEADWFMHIDADEIRCALYSGQSLGQGIKEVAQQGYNAINFQEFTFTPTREFPDHDHADYLQTMRSYYPFRPDFPHQLKAWKKPACRAELSWSGGHLVRFHGLNMYPLSFKMRHYQFLSPAHAIEKYVDRRYDPAEIADGWHCGRPTLRAEDIKLPATEELRYYLDDDRLDSTNPRTSHFLFPRGVRSHLPE